MCRAFQQFDTVGARLPQKLEDQVLVLDRLKALKEEARVLKNETLDSKIQRYLRTETAVEELKAVAQNKCRELCSGLQAALPRELRDMVYGFIFHKLALAYEEGYFECARNCMQLSQYRMRCDKFCVWHYFDPVYMGMRTVEKIIYTWYRTETFEFHGRFDPPQATLSRAPMGLNYRPADFITSIWLHTDLWYPERQEQSMLLHLKALADLCPTTKLVIWFQYDGNLSPYIPPRDNPRHDLSIALGRMLPYLAGLRYDQLQFLDDKENAVVVRSQEEHNMDG
jgi:hypothetical protein